MSEQQTPTIPDVIITPENSPQPKPMQTGNQRIVEETEKGKTDGSA